MSALESHLEVLGLIGLQLGTIRQTFSLEKYKDAFGWLTGYSLPLLLCLPSSNSRCLLDADVHGMADKMVDEEPPPSGLLLVLPGNEHLERTLGITLFVFVPVAMQGTDPHWNLPAALESGF